MLLIEKNKILTFGATGMDLASIILAEIAKSERQRLHDFTYMCNLKQSKQKPRLIEQTSACQKGGGKKEEGG